MEEYLESEMSGEIKHEYIYGEVYAIAGTSDRHNRIAMNIGSKFFRVRPGEPTAMRN